MINPASLALGTKRNTIMDLADYGRSRAAIIGKENVFDFSIGNPSIPAPELVQSTLLDILQNSGAAGWLRRLLFCKRINPPDRPAA